MKKLLISFAVLSALVLAGACKNASAAPAEGDGNPVIEAIMNRRAIRAYKDTAVPRELLQQVAECGVWAPNAMNAQNWAVRIVDSPEYINGITEIYKKSNAQMVARDPNFKNMFRNAPAFIAVAAPENQFSAIDCGLLGENIMLAAYSLGLGTCCQAGPVMFLNSPAAAEYLKKLDFPEGYRLLYVIGIGYPDETPEPRPRDLSKIKFVD